LANPPYQRSHKQPTPIMQGLKGELYDSVKPALGGDPYFYYFKHAGKIIKLKQVKPELSHTRVAK
jgi:hypothetical protein